MLRNKFKIGFLGAALLAVVVSCSNEDSSETAQGQGQVISNDEMKLTSGSDLLGKFMALKNAEIEFDQLAKNGPAAAALNAIQAVSTYQPNLTNAVALTGNQWYEITAGTKYYIPANTTFTGGINFNGAGTLIILGNLGGSNWINVASGGTVEVAPSGQILPSANFHLNGGSTLNNYGNVTYATESVDGTINNYSDLVFSKALSINGSAIVNNNCSMTFNGFVYVNALLNSNAFSLFKNGFHINGGGKLRLDTGSLVDVTGGTIGVDGKIENNTSGYARFDISNATLGNINANPAFVGKIDINTTVNIPASKIDSEVLNNANTFIAPNGCVPQRGVAVAACNDDLLSFTLTATVESPTVNEALLSATDVKVINNKAYVTYHTNDEAFGDAPNGAIRVFNIENQQSPQLIAQADFFNAEFNGIDVSNNTLYAVGGNKAGARLVSTPLTQGSFNTTDLAAFVANKLPSNAAKNAVMLNDKLGVVAGPTNGGFFKVDPASNYEVTEQFYNQGTRAKYVTQNGTYQAFFAVEANAAYVRIANMDGSNPREYTYPALAQTIQNGKNVIAMDNDFLYLALSDSGVAKIALSNGVLTNHFVPNDYRVMDKKVFKNNGYTNAVAVNECYLYLANGADGVIVLNKNSFQVVGAFKLSESANYVYAQNGMLFVATGRNGLNIIKIN